MKAILLEDYYYIFNDYTYNKDQIIEIEELEEFSKYARYHHDSLDWIPKDIVQIIDK